MMDERDKAKFRDVLHGLGREHLISIIPACPQCKQPLVARLPNRRFMEDDRFVECPEGHAWHLSSVYR